MFTCSDARFMELMSPACLLSSYSRVAELEEENARLLAIASNKQQDDAPEDLISEVEQLRRELAAAQERERALNDQLSRKAIAQPQPVKMETFEPELPSRAASVQPQKSGASLGLMVCFNPPV